MLESVQVQFGKAKSSFKQRNSNATSLSVDTESSTDPDQAVVPLSPTMTATLRENFPSQRSASLKSPVQTPPISQYSSRQSLLSKRTSSMVSPPRRSVSSTGRSRSVTHTPSQKQEKVLGMNQ